MADAVIIMYRPHGGILLFIASVSAVSRSESLRSASCCSASLCGNTTCRVSCRASVIVVVVVVVVAPTRR